MPRTPSAAHARLRGLVILTVAVLAVTGIAPATASAAPPPPAAPTELPAATAAAASVTTSAEAGAVAEVVAPATVSGRVTDSFGDPVEGAEVGVVSVDPRSAAEQWAVTGADGRYTVAAAPAGIAVVVAVESPEPWLHHQFWPGTSDPDEAATLVLAAGESRTAMDVVLPDAGALGGVVRVPAGMDEYCVTASAKHLWYDLPTVTGCAAAGEPYVVGPLPGGGYVVEAAAFSSSGTARTASLYRPGRPERWAAEEVVVWGTHLRDGVDIDLSAATVLGSTPATVSVSSPFTTPMHGFLTQLHVRVTGPGTTPTGVVEIWGEKGAMGSGTLTDGVASVLTEIGSDLEVYYGGDAVHAPSTTPLELGVRPTVRGAEPASGAVTGGTRVSVRGAGLSGATGVTFGGVPGTGVQVVSDEEVLVTTPPHAAGSTDVIVTTPVAESWATGTHFMFVDAVAVAPTRAVSDLSVPAGVVRCVPVAGRHGVPTTATGVTVNVTTVRPSGAGYVVVYPDTAGDGRTPPPGTSTVNFEPGQDVANGTFVALPPSGRLCYATAGAERAGVLLDVTGWIGADAGVTLRTPQRLLDTRPGEGHVGAVSGPVERRQVHTVEVAGRAGVSAGARAVLVNVTVTGATAAGNLRVFPTGQTVPHTSVVNYAPGQDKAAGTVVAVPASGGIAFWSDTDAPASENPVHVIIDVLGEVSGSAALRAVPPVRLLDTRAESQITGRLVPRQVYSFYAPSSPVTPDRVSALVLNVTAIGPGSVGNLRVYPDSDGTRRTPPPWASSVNYIPGRTIANQVVVAVPSNRRITLYSDGWAPVDVAVDLVGYVAAE